MSQTGAVSSTSLFQVPGRCKRVYSNEVDGSVIPECAPPVMIWQADAEIQSGDVLLVRIDDSLMAKIPVNNTGWVEI